VDDVTGGSKGSGGGSVKASRRQQPRQQQPRRSRTANDVTGGGGGGGGEEDDDDAAANRSSRSLDRPAADDGGGSDGGGGKGGGVSDGRGFDWGPITLSSISPISIVHGRPVETLQLLRTVLSLLGAPLWCPDGARGLSGIKRTVSAHARETTPAPWMRGSSKA
jgi:hypothetical protein